MQIIDLKPEHHDAYFNCLGDGTSDFSIGTCRKKEWFACHADSGLSVKLAVDDDKKPIGMVQYGPAKIMFPQDHELAFIHCIWVLKQSKNENYQNRGIGKALLRAVEDDVQQRGFKGLVAWGVALPVFMRASWFRRQGFKKIDKKGIAVLLWKPYAPDAVPVRWERDLKVPDRVRGKVDLTVLSSGWCTVMNANVENAIKAAEDFGDTVVVHEVDTRDRKNLVEWGQPDAIFLDGKQIAKGPPLSYEQIHKIIARQVKKKSRLRALSR